MIDPTAEEVPLPETKPVIAPDPKQSETDAAAGTMSRRRPLSEEERELVDRLCAFDRAAASRAQKRRACRRAIAITATGASAPAKVRHDRRPARRRRRSRRWGGGLRQRVARGREPIDARLDLHGFTQAEAHAELLRFLAPRPSGRRQDRAGRDREGDGARSAAQREQRRAQAASAAMAVAAGIPPSCGRI